MTLAGRTRFFCLALLAARFLASVVGGRGHGVFGFGRPRWAPSRARTINGACKSTSILTPLGSSTARTSQIAFPSCAGARDEASRRANRTTRRRTCGSRRAIVAKNARDSASASRKFENETGRSIPSRNIAVGLLRAFAHDVGGFDELRPMRDRPAHQQRRAIMQRPLTTRLHQAGPASVQRIHRSDRAWTVRERPSFFDRVPRQ